jgi:hypothetical protein
VPIRNRTLSGAGCPFCAGRRATKARNLAVGFPKLAREWHPTKNGSLTPSDVVAGTSRRVWWRCAFRHDWQAAVSSRSGNGTGCPECWRLRSRRPVATTGKKRSPVHLGRYEGARHGPVRRVK